MKTKRRICWQIRATSSNENISQFLLCVSHCNYIMRKIMSDDAFLYMIHIYYDAARQIFMMIKNQI